MLSLSHSERLLMLDVVVGHRSSQIIQPELCKKTIDDSVELSVQVCLMILSHNLVKS